MEASGCLIFQAVCCEDKLHCCPQNTKCNLTTSSCDKISGVKSPSIELVLKSPTTVKCPDGQTSCPDTNICCKTSDGGYSCCPYTNVSIYVPC